MPCFSSLTVLARHGSGFRSLEHRLGQSDGREHLSKKQNNKENTAKMETAIELAAVGKDEAATGGGLTVQGMGLVEGVLQHGLGRISGKPQVCELWHMQMTSRLEATAHLRDPPHPRDTSALLFRPGKFLGLGLSKLDLVQQATFHRWPPARWWSSRAAGHSSVLVLRKLLPSLLAC